VLDFYRITRTDVTAANPLGNTLVSVSPRSTMNWTFSNNVITIPGGTFGDYLLDFMWKGTASPNSVGPGATFSTGLTLVSSVGSVGVAGGLSFWNDWIVTVDGTQSSYTITFDATGTGLPVGSSPNQLLVDVTEIPRAPPASCAIFDPAGLEYEDRYDQYMMSILSPVEQAKYRSHAGRKLSPQNSNVADRFENRKLLREAAFEQFQCKLEREKARAPTFAVIGDEKTGNCFRATEQECLRYYDELNLYKVKGFWWCTDNKLPFESGKAWVVDFGSVDPIKCDADLYYRIAMEQKPGRLSSEEKELIALALKYKWASNEKTTKATSTSFDNKVPDVVVEVGLVESSSSTSSEEEVPGMDPYTVLRRVGNYGYLSCNDGHFVVRTFESDKMKWWFLNEDNGFEKVFMETFSELLANEFMTCIDSIIEKKINPESDSLKAVSARKMLFRKRGSKDYSTFNPNPGSV